MFSIARYDPSQQSSEDKKDKLASLNDRLKRKRTKESDVQLLPPPTSPSVQNVKSPVEATQQEETIEEPPQKKPHREKQKKVTRVVEEEDDTAGVSSKTKVAHILQKFHKVQERASARHEEPREEVEEEKALEEEPVADLVPVPQPSKSAVKRQTIASNAGLPFYLQNPNVIATSGSVPFPKLPLSKKIQDNLQKCEFESAFAVQAALLPVLLDAHLPEDRHDILVSAPTGSGKTLTYTLPILQTLQTRRITRLRALIIVPTRELVQQVQSTFESLSSKLGLKIEALSATRPFAVEQGLLVNDYEPTAPSNVDILICTPGRLVDHIKSTARFTLRDLRFLVIDEGDRLLNQSFQGWSTEINEALKPLETTDMPSTIDLFTTKSEEHCQKLIFSATMSTDPSLLAQLNLRNPALYLIQDRGSTDGEDLEGEDVVSKFTTPSTLSEYFVHVPDSVPKPLTLLTMLHRMDIKKALVFTNSNESAQKLSSLMNQFNLGRCEAFTSSLTPSLRRRHLADFVTPTLNFLICSDLMARGIDTTVECVVNYDSSISTRQYVHRVGRTARAGKQGRAMSLVEGHEGKYWWRQIGGRKIRRSMQVQRITLFPKPAPQQPDPNTVEDQAQQSDSEPEEESDVEQDQISQAEKDKDDEEEGGDEDSMSIDDEQSKLTEKVAPIVQLLEVDQDQLKQTYETALKTLRSRS